MNHWWTMSSATSWLTSSISITVSSFYAEVDRILGIAGEAKRRDRELNRVSRSLSTLGRYR